jgi:AAA+ ATPase superfamily predicted ATPase
MMQIRKFVNRERELEALEKEYGKEAFSLFVIYGRRRVGKTELLRRFGEGKPFLYFLSDKRGTPSNALRFRKKVADFLGEPEIASQDLVEIFEHLSRRWQRQEKLIVVIDEFSYLVERDDTIPSVFQTIVDENLSKRPNFFLILCGSSIGMMERGALSSRSPLYGRRTGQWRVNPLRLGEAAALFPGVSPEEVMRIYSVVGGVPFYLRLFDPKKSIYQNIEENFLSKEGLLYPEGEFLLREELRDPSTFLSILLSMACGATRLSEIASKSGMQAKDLPHYLRALERLGIVGRETPVLEKPRTKRSLYRIRDNFFNFWARFVYPHRDEIELGNPSPALQEIRREFETLVSQRFEEVCLDFVRERMGFSKLGRQWGKVPGSGEAYEIDAVGLDGRRMAFFEFKWKGLTLRDCLRIVDELRSKAELVGWKGERLFGIIGKEVPEKEKLRRGGHLVFDLEDMIPSA